MLSVSFADLILPSDEEKRDCMATLEIGMSLALSDSCCVLEVFVNYSL